MHNADPMPKNQANGEAAPGSAPAAADRASDHRAGADRPPGDDSVDLLTQTQSLRRKVVFWRRTAGIVLTTAALILIVAWNRGEVRRRECFDALKQLTTTAQRVKLTEQDPGILEDQWRQFATSEGGFTAAHYNLIVHNWAARLLPGEDLPLAVCRESHLSTFSRGRHVLHKTAGGLKIIWMDEKVANNLALEAQKDDASK